MNPAPFLALSLLAARPGHPPASPVRELPSFDAVAAYPARALPTEALRDGRLVKPGMPVETEKRFGVPTFLFAAPSGDALTPRQAGATPEAAARQHLARYAPLYGLQPQDAQRVKLLSVHDLGTGPVVVRFGELAGRLPVFREELAIAMNRELEAVALSGYLTPLPRTLAAAKLDPAHAMLAALQAVQQPEVLASALLAHPRAAGEVRFGLAPDAKVAFTREARLRPVAYALPDRVEPAYLVELFLQDPEGLESQAYAVVVSALDGRMLFRKSLVAHDTAFSYRVWADDDAQQNGLGRPYDGPQGDGPTPHPTGDIAQPIDPAFVAPNLISRVHGPTTMDDPWLPAGATETVGNNADAYVDLFPPDGYSPSSGDFRASVTSPGVFDRTYDVTRDAESSAEQQKASIAQLFYDVNFLHDWYYTVGFDEAAGNGQSDNFGRGGIGDDPLLAEAQDYSGRNNSNMQTPGDGLSPVMQMYIFDAASPTSVQVTAPASIAGTLQAAGSSYGPQTYSLSGTVYRVTGANQDACAGFSTADADAIHGKIALVDRGTCAFVDKMAHVQAAGAQALIIGQNRAEPPFEISDSPDPTLTIVTVMIGQADAAKLRSTATEPTVTLTRTAGIDRDGTIDNHIVAHEWGHYISNRLIHDGMGLDTNMAGGLGEGWADFHALLLTVRAEDSASPVNAFWSGLYPLAGYTSAGVDPQNGWYFGIRRVPYSIDLSKDPLTFIHIQEGVPLPSDVPVAFGQDGYGNSEVHNVGEVWASMLWECYAAMLRDVPGRLSFDEAQTRMRAYLVAAYKLTPQSPTLLEARDAVLAAAYASDAADFAHFQAAFAKRGAGVRAVGPDRFDDYNLGVVEDYHSGNDLAFVSAALDDSATSCDHDGVLDDGETGTLRITLKNVGVTALTATTATITSSNPAVQVGQGGVVTFAASQPFETVSAEVPVTLSGATSTTVVDLAIAFTDPAITNPEQVVGLQVAGNQDLLPQSSATDDAESAHVVWTAAAVSGQDADTGQPWDTAAAWKRVEDGPTAHHFFGVDDGQPSELTFTSPPLSVGPGDFRFSFTSRYAFEAGDDGTGTGDIANFDGAVLELSTDDGATWVDIGAQASPGYNGTLYDGSGNPLAGRAAFVATNPSWPDADTVTVDLGTAYAGQQVMVRFVVGSDAAASAYGWDVDDIAFTGITNRPFDSVIADRGLCESDPPVASAKGPSVVRSGETATLDGSASTSPHGTPLSYQWAQIGGPTVSLSDPTAASPTFVGPAVDAATSLRFELRVRDGASNGLPATVTVAAIPGLSTAPAGATFQAGSAPSSGCSAGGAGFELLAVLGALGLLKRRRD